MHNPIDRIAHTTAFVTPVVEHWLEREIAQWVHLMKDRSDGPSHHERTLLPQSYISHPVSWLVFTTSIHVVTNKISPKQQSNFNKTKHLMIYRNILNLSRIHNKKKAPMFISTSVLFLLCLVRVTFLYSVTSSWFTDPKTFDRRFEHRVRYTFELSNC